MVSIERATQTMIFIRGSITLLREQDCRDESESCREKCLDTSLVVMVICNNILVSEAVLHQLFSILHDKKAQRPLINFRVPCSHEKLA